MYQPNPIPEAMDMRQILSAVWDELQKIANELETGVSSVVLVELHAAPERLEDGMVVLADGTDWDPGSGAGYYGYQNGSWTFLG